jgi:hypothetical protein
VARHLLDALRLGGRRAGQREADERGHGEAHANQVIVKSAAKMSIDTITFVGI